MFFSISFFFLYKIIQLMALIAVVFLVISLINRNQHRTYIQPQPFQTTQMPPPPPPPRRAVPRRHGCLSFLGAIVIVVVIILGIQTSVRHDRSHRLSEPEKRLQELAQQKKNMENRLEREIPEFVRLLYAQANEIKKELNNVTDSAHKDYLMEELKDIAKTFVFLDKEEGDYKEIISELSSIQRTLVRLKESEKLFGAEYETFMNQSRNAVTKAKAKMNVKINLDMDNNISLSEIQVQEKVEELLK